MAPRRPSPSLDPEGKRPAVGYYAKLPVDFYDATTLAFRGHADTSAFGEDDFGQVAWRADGRALVGGGLFGEDDASTCETEHFRLVWS